MMSWARVHRWLAITLVALLVVWSVTGLLFHLKPGWSRAYDMLSAERRDSPLPVEGIASVQAVAAGVGAPILKLELIDTALGPVYRVRTAKGTELVDARNGARMPPLGTEAARMLVLDALARSPHREEYGDVVRESVTDAKVRFELSKGPVVEVGRSDARLSQRGPDTDRVDWLYRVHYLQWTGNAGIDRVLAVVGLLLIWAVMIPGVVLFVQRLRRRTG